MGRGRYEQETNAPMIPMDPFSNPPIQDPPPYAYAPLTPESSRPSRSVSPYGKAVPSPPPSESIETSQIPSTPRTWQPYNSVDPLMLSDERFADIILKNVILPRLRVGIYKWKDRESFEF